MQFLVVLKYYSIEVIPAVLIGFFISGIIHELVPTNWVEKHLGAKGIKPILYSTVIGALLPICCWGSLPVALSFYKKGSRLGPILAFLVATPATSVSALIVSYRILGPAFTIYMFFSVIIMGLVIGILGNNFNFEPKKPRTEICPHCGEEAKTCGHGSDVWCRIKSILKFTFIEMPKEIGLEIIVGLVLAAAVSAFVPLGHLIKTYLSGPLSYLFSVVVGLLMYFCSTASVPLIDALIKQGMNVGAAFVLLLIGPITSYGTILVLKKEFGMKLLAFFLITISVTSVMLGYLYVVLF